MCFSMCFHGEIYVRSKRVSKLCKITTSIEEIRLTKPFMESNSVKNSTTDLFYLNLNLYLNSETESYQVITFAILL